MANIVSWRDRFRHNGYSKKAAQCLCCRLSLATIASTMALQISPRGIFYWLIECTGMKLLNGKDLAGFIKERQAKTVRGLRQAHNVAPRLAIIQAKDDPVINTYVKLKKQYGADILVDVDIHIVK